MNELLLVVTIGGQRVAFPADAVESVVELDTLIPVPRSAPHVAGLSRSGRLWVYVSAGTGTWGPPVRFGSEPELTVLRLVSG